MKISLIAALSLNHVIGKGGGLPWNLPADQEHFWRTAGGRVFIMGRGSYAVDEPLLSDHKNIILTRHPEKVATSATVHTAPDLDTALQMVGEEEEIFILGGGEIFRLSLPRADRLYLTIVETTLEGDTFFPGLNWSDWQLVRHWRHRPDARHRYAFSVNVYDRTTA